MSRATAARLVAAAASGALLAAARPPLDLGPLAAVALVPLFVAWRGRPTRAVAGYTALAAVVYHALLVSWVWYFGVVATIALIGILTAYWAAAGALLGWLAGRGLRSPWLTAAVWVCLEGAIARAPLSGFSWGEVGYAFHAIAPVRAAASVGGVALVSFLAVATNALVADLVGALWRRRDAAARPAAWLRSAVQAGVGIVVVAVLVTAMALTRAEPAPDGHLRVAVLQGNNLNRELTGDEEVSGLLPDSHLALSRQVHDHVDLIVFPESSMNSVREYRLTDDPRLAQVARDHGAWVLANATVAAPGDPARNANLNALYRPDGTVEGTYAKRHLVPYGEYVPLRSVIEQLVPSVRDQIPYDDAAGSAPGLFDVAGTRVATVICFESAFGYQVRSLVRDGAHVIVVSTNNRSYRRSANSAQHVAIGQMRAVETGRPVVQAAISGISAIIDANGNVHGRTRLFDRTVLERTVTATRGQTPYVRYGEWVLWGSAIAVLGTVTFAVARRRRKPSVDSGNETDDDASSVDVRARTLTRSGDRA